MGTERTKQALLGSLLAVSTDAIITIDEKHNIRIFNEGAELIFGYSSAEVLGKPVDILLPLRFGRSHREHVKEFADSPQSSRLMHGRRELIGSRKDGTEFPAEASIAKLETGKAKAFTVILRDITERKRLEYQLLQNERLSTLGQLTATVSHELRNPLGVIRTSAFIVRDNLNEETPRVQRALERIERNIIRCDRIIDELLDFTRASEIQAQPTPIHAWLEETLNEQTLLSGVVLRRDFGPGDLTVSLDHDRFRRAVINVFDNACQAMTGEGTEDTGSAEHSLTVRTQEHDGRAEVIFEDTGPGIPPDVYERIFEPLYSTKGFGIGLGLPVVKQIMEQHGGGIEIESEEGRGTQVCLWLPTSPSTH